MKIYYEELGHNLSLDCRHYIPITYCLNCNEPIRNTDNIIKEYCNIECQEEHELIMKYTIEDEYNG